MTRRTFLETIGTVTMFSAVTAVSSTASTRPGRPSQENEAWRRARDVVRSGALGTIMWGQISRDTVSQPAQHELRSVLDAMGLPQPPVRVSTLRSPDARMTKADATTIFEFTAGPPVYVVDSREAETIIRGSHARLHIRDGQLRVTSCAI
jgi:hypothetical protein